MNDKYDLDLAHRARELLDKLYGLKDELKVDNEILLNTLMVMMTNDLFNEGKDFETIKNDLKETFNEILALLDVYVKLEYGYYYCPKCEDRKEED